MTVLFRSNDERILLILLSVIGVLLTATTIRGSFIIDEVNYAVTVIGLRHGTLAVPGTENLGPSKELFFFDPESENRAATSAPVVSLAPALYAPIALPFSLAGWRGLAFLNTLSFLCAAAFVYFFTRRIAADPATSWVAISLFVLGGYEFEYAQGVWPHMLSVALCAGALLLASDVWQHSSARSAVWAGVLFGIACGIREQNVFLAICLGGTFLVVGSRKLLSAASYAGGVAIPMMVSSTINYFKLGVWFPTPKAAAYSGMVSASVPAASWLEPLKVFLVKVVDFSTFGLFRDPTVFVDYSRDPSTGAFLVGGVVKKALLQSSPWFALALVVALLVWFTKRVSSETARSSVKALAFLLLPTLAIFSAAGFRTDGLSFNQRYLLELLPIASILVALSLDGLRLSFQETFAGVLFAGLMFAVTLMIPGRACLQIATLRVPMVLGLFLILLWTFRGHPSARRFLGVALGVCIGWSLSMETIDLLASREIRTRHAVVLDSLEQVLPDHSALFAYWGQQKAAAGPIQFSRDVVILDLWADAGKDAPRLARYLMIENRRVFLIATGVPPGIIQTLRGDDSLAAALTKPVLLYEIVRKHNEPVVPGGGDNQSFHTSRSETLKRLFTSGRP